jgi:hypothetical protein
MAPALLDLLGYRLGKSSLEEEAVKDVPYRQTYQNLLEDSVFNNYKRSTIPTSHCLHTLSKYRLGFLRYFFYCILVLSLQNKQQVEPQTNVILINLPNFLPFSTIRLPGLS